MKVLFITNIPSPYRVDFFNELGKQCELEVVFEREHSTERDESWKNYEFRNFKGTILEGANIGKDKAVTGKILPFLKQRYDHIIVANPATPVGMLSILYLKWKKKRYYIEGDGARYIRQNSIKEQLKSKILGKAAGYFSTSEELDYYYRMYGADGEKIYRYPFSSVHAREIQEKDGLKEKKLAARQELKLPQDKKLILSIGRFEHIKGFDLLIRCAGKLKQSQFYIVGGEETEEYRQLLEENEIRNVVFKPFMKKEALSKYFLAADIFVLPTRYDPWGLVINEAMAYGLPVISTDRCVAALELLENGRNGYVVPAGDAEALEEKIRYLLENDNLCGQMQVNNLNKIKNYTIETMAGRHIEILNQI